MQSFEMVQVIHDKILNHLVNSIRTSQFVSLTDCTQGADWVPMVIIGNKSDLRPEQRQVSVEDGKKLADRYNCAWTEASARYNENVSKAFELMIGQIEKAQNPNEPTADGKCVMM